MTTTRDEKLSDDVWWRIQKWRRTMNAGDVEQIAIESVELDRALRRIARSKEK